MPIVNIANQGGGGGGDTAGRSWTGVGQTLIYAGTSNDRWAGGINLSSTNGGLRCVMLQCGQTTRLLGQTYLTGEHMCNTPAANTVRITDLAIDATFNYKVTSASFSSGAGFKPIHVGSSIFVDSDMGLGVPGQMWINFVDGSGNAWLSFTYAPNVSWDGVSTPPSTLTLWVLRARRAAMRRTSIQV